MKATHFNKIFFFFAIITVVLFACKKEVEIYLPEQTDLSSKAFVKVYNSVINTTRNYVYIDDCSGYRSRHWLMVPYSHLFPITQPLMPETGLW